MTVTVRQASPRSPACCSRAPVPACHRAQAAKASAAAAVARAPRSPGDQRRAARSAETARGWKIFLIAVLTMESPGDVTGAEGTPGRLTSFITASITAAGGGAPSECILQTLLIAPRRRAQQGGFVKREDPADDDLKPGREVPAVQSLEKSTTQDGLNRRVFLALSLGAVPAVSLAATSVQEVRTAAARAAPGSATMPVRLNVNGVDRQLRVDPRTSLLDALREEMALAGTKKGCDHGQCGACTVLVDGRRVLSCLTLAAMASGHRVTTVEGLAQGDRLHPVQAAFLKHDAFQCGYCTPGQIVSAVGLLAEGCPDDPAHIRECMSGNLCRCGAYPNIVAAVREAKGGKVS